MSEYNPKADFYFHKAEQWREAAELLREISLDTPLAEEVKWGCPCYTLNGKNVWLIHHFKDYIALLFPKGVLLPDPEKLLIQQTPNMQSARQLRFTSAAEIKENRPKIFAFLLAAIEVEKSEIKVNFKNTAAFVEPSEWTAFKQNNPEVAEAFGRLTPGRQRGYLLYFNGAKQSKTKWNRIELSIPKILEGKAHNEQ